MSAFSREKYELKGCNFHGTGHCSRDNVVCGNKMCTTFMIRVIQDFTVFSWLKLLVAVRSAELDF